MNESWASMLACSQTERRQKAAEIRNKLAAINKERLVLLEQVRRMDMETYRLIKECPHPSRSPYRACGVETGKCDYCGDEVYVREY